MAQSLVNRSALVKSLSNVGTGLFGLLYFILYKSLGLLPWHFNYLKLFKWNPAIEFYNYGFSTSLLGTFWNILCGLSVAYLNYIYVADFPEILPKKIGLMIVKEQKCMQGASFGLLSLIQVIYGCRQGTLINALNEVQGLDNRLMQITGQKVKNGCSAYWIFFGNLAMCAGVLAAKYIELDGKPFFQFFMTVFPSVFVSLLVVQYVMALDVVIKRFVQLHYAIIKADNTEDSHFRQQRAAEQSMNGASRQRKIEFVSILLEDLNDIRLDIIWFFSPQLGIATLNMAGLAAIIGYDINRMWKGKSQLEDMELFMYGLWYAAAILVLLVLTIYYALAKMGEKWARYRLWLITDFRQQALAAGSRIEAGTSNQPQKLLEGDEDLLSLDVTLP